MRQAKASSCEVELSKKPLHSPEAFVSHANAQLTPRARLRLARLIVESGWTQSTAARMFMVSPRTAAKWAARYRAALSVFGIRAFHFEEIKLERRQ